MDEDNQTTQMFDELQDRLNHLESEVGELRRKSGGGGQRSMPNRRDEVVSPDPFRRSEVFPPSTQGEPESIVGGKMTTDFPDCCAVGDDTEFYCTGTLIAPRLVVTAQHCPDLRRVFLKGNDVSRLDTGEVIRVVDNKEHPSNDLRVLVLERDSAVKPRHVAQGAEVGNPKKARLVGFGTVNLGGTIGYGVKRMVDVPITSLGCESANDQTKFGCSGGKEMVAGHKGLLKDSCRGDSGGPLYIKSSTGAYYLLGATSRGLGNTNNVCGDGGIYVRVDKFLDWIRQETGIDVEGPLD
ncbi:MAG TPA: trypsin-like serine protease [Pyrinomonadaceae bacterium]